MASNKRQHFVPRFYLKNFSEYQSGRSIGVWNIRTKTLVRQASLKHQACRPYFYGRDCSTEKWFAELEALAASEIRKCIITEQIPRPGSGGHLTLISFILLQRARTLYKAEEQNEMMGKLLRLLFAGSPTAPQNLDKLRVKSGEASQVAISSTLKTLPIVMDLKAKLLKADRPGIPFITTDNPVVLYNQYLENWATGYSSGGLAQKGLQIFFPLSPRYCLMLFDPGIYRVGSRKNRSYHRFPKPTFSKLISSRSLMHWSASTLTKHFQSWTLRSCIALLLDTCKEIKQTLMSTILQTQVAIMVLLSVFINRLCGWV